MGPGRGSGAGSVVAWALTITDLDPLRWGLLFERFLNPERVSMPDFDVDFCQERRDEVITLCPGQVRAHDHVAQIITFGKLQARAALRDVGRGLADALSSGRSASAKLDARTTRPVRSASPGGDRNRASRAFAGRCAIEDETGGAHCIDIALKIEGLYPPRLDPRRRRGYR